MWRLREVVTILAMAACGSILSHRPALAGAAESPRAQNTANAPGPTKLMVTVGKSLIIDSPLNIMRVLVSNADLAEAVAVNPKEVLINGKTPGETSLIVWQQSGQRLVYDLTVRMSGTRLESARQQIARDFPDDVINVTFENDTAFVRGTVKDVTSAERVMAVAATLGKAVNLLRVEVPAVEPQILLRVKFANVDRSASLDLGLHLFNTSFNQQTSTGTGYALFPDPSGLIPVKPTTNILLVRPDINLLAELQALEAKRTLEFLAEPNLLTISGQSASFLAGGEFPCPVVQPTSTGLTTVTIMWREYGVRLNFVPVVTPRGTIRLKVAPEVSSLDYTNAITIQGFVVPGLSTRRVQTEVELGSGQSFVIAGLLDNQTTDSFSKVPGIGSIPILGKLFQTKNVARNNSELLVVITPELVRPIPEGQPTPDLTFPLPFLKNVSKTAPRQPGMDKTGQVPVKPAVDTLPYERLAQPAKMGQTPMAASPGETPAGPAPAAGKSDAPAPAPPAAGSGK